MENGEKKITLRPTQYDEINPYKLNFFNIWKKFPKNLIFIIISAFLYNIGVALFLGKAATVASGISAIVQGLTYSLPITQKYFAFIYLGLNIPFIIAFWKKNNRKFMLCTLYWLLFQVVAQSIFLIPQVQSAVNSLTIFNMKIEKAGGEIVKVPWEVYTKTYELKLGLTAAETLKIQNPTWPIIVYSLVGGVLSGAAAGIAWKNHGSTAGSDVFIYYISKMKKKSVGSVSFIIAIIFALFSIIIIGFLEGFGVNPNINWAEDGFIVRIISTAIYIFIFNLFINLIYPKYKKVKIEIYTKKPNEVISHLRSIGYWHGYNYSPVTSGFNDSTSTKVETVALLLELSFIKAEILKIDPSAFIDVTYIYHVFGDFNTSKVD
ncbi:uncharacterized membrane-anchored protein YitT (DUF2179 family) [Metamycoplasma subdolum]|uniref:Uncharacterized membrane-anchored protein YitT (DUF2179 family) n=1 Tax=Metamycoplasma subdolum TaxID=92407 RepID=A0A3L9ZYS4_9BACT|nr:YitT family protein [Metamycoplasma subdolum]RMA77596.1 uncharacterized membrane-anchored protein YitT (DUF2179 family) [Metamycoplasma subdolum]WPB50390.1 YitT family protein [Metamycoplasma subdolum]